MNTSDVTRFEIIDHTPCDNCDGSGIYLTPTDTAAGQSVRFREICKVCGGRGMIGREVIFYDKNKEVDVELQDDGRTLKVFIHERYEDEQDN